MAMVNNDTPLLNLPLSAAAKRMVAIQSEYRVLSVGLVREAIDQRIIHRWKGVGPTVERELVALLKGEKA